MNTVRGNTRSECFPLRFMFPESWLTWEYLVFHREAVVPEEEALCIMCHKSPKGSNDHFCSKECRENALLP